MDQGSLLTPPDVERIRKRLHDLNRGPKRGDGLDLKAEVELPPRLPTRRMPVPFWATGIFILLVLGVMWGPSRWVADSVISLHGQRRLTPALLSRPTGGGPSFVARRPTVIRAESDGTRLITFRLLAPAARGVWVGGSFNDYDAARGPLVRGKDGIWETTLRLRPGLHTYKFKVDGVWLLDPTNPEKTPEPRERSLINVPS
ncbi:MAG: hypothetical protein IPN90_13900 [Elusimicrobia bacterium]|nr:hypothetical protein [Elusimicrobiota bacterium]